MLHQALAGAKAKTEVMEKEKAAAEAEAVSLRSEVERLKVEVGKTDEVHDAVVVVMCMVDGLAMDRVAMH